MTSFLFKVTQSAFALGEVLAPKVAGRLAFELFCLTPGKSRLTDGEKLALVNAAPIMVNARNHWLTTRYGRIAAYELRPDNWQKSYPTVLVVHGWRSRSEHLSGLSHALARAGFRVISIDLPGHGRSSGRRIDMLRAVAACQEASQWFGPFEAGIGHSFGGAVLAAAHGGLVRSLPPVSFGRLVLVSTPASMRSVFDHFAEIANLGKNTRAAMDKNVLRLSGTPVEGYSIPAVLAANPISTLVVHCRNDKEIDVGNADLINAAGPHVERELVNGFGHRRIINAPCIHEKIVGFVAERTSMAA